MRQMARERLARKGSEISGAGRRWHMMEVHGPLSNECALDAGAQFFLIETSSEETLLVSRGPGEKGMRELYLWEVTRGRAS